MQREFLTTSRSLEFFSKKELSMQLGESNADLWGIALIKEMIDNSLDGCESAGIDPVVKIDTDYKTYFSVEDNGPGLPDSVIRQSLDYTIRVSDKNYYISPSRGQLGNALKCLWAAPYVLEGELGKVEVETRGKHYQIQIILDRIAQEPKFEIQVENSNCKKWTKFKVHSEKIASSLENIEILYFYNLGINELLEGFALSNPHAAIYLNDYPIHKNVMGIKKWTPDLPLSTHWYNIKDFENLIAGYLSNGKDIHIRELVSGFSGLKSSAKQKKVLDSIQMQRGRLSDLVRDNAVDIELASALLESMKAESRPISAKALGMIGQDHILRELSDICEFTDYRNKLIDVENIPFVIEVGFGILKDKEQQRHCRFALNWSAALRTPAKCISDAMISSQIGSSDPVILFCHIISPKLDFSDRGKSLLNLPDAVSTELFNKINLVSKQWSQLKRKADREGKVKERALEQWRQDQRKKKLNVKEAAFQVMEKAYLKASGNGKYPASARQIMYAARPDIISLTGKTKPWANDSYFTQDILIKFIEKYPKLTESWDIIFDARGSFIEPFTDIKIPLGTLAVRRYISAWSHSLRYNGFNISLPNQAVTSGPFNRYDKVLFIEKEGFAELLKIGSFAERYDLAIMSTKGMSVTAARSLVEALSQQGVTIYVLRDFDKAGFSIVHTLKNSNHRYKFKKKPNVVDLGLRLDDIQALGLGDEPVYYSDQKDPKINMMKNGATKAESEFLCSGGYAGNWYGKRVELNQMTSDQFIDWLDLKLKDATKIIPKIKDIQSWYERAYKQAVFEQKTKKYLKEIENLDIEIPADLKDVIKNKLEKNEHISWDTAVYGLAYEKAKP